MYSGAKRGGGGGGRGSNGGRGSGGGARRDSERDAGTGAGGRGTGGGKRGGGGASRRSEKAGGRYGARDNNDMSYDYSKRAVASYANTGSERWDEGGRHRGDRVERNWSSGAGGWKHDKNAKWGEEWEDREYTEEEIAAWEEGGWAEGYDYNYDYHEQPAAQTRKSPPADRAGAAARPASPQSEYSSDEWGSEEYGWDNEGELDGRGGGGLPIKRRVKKKPAPAQRQQNISPPPFPADSAAPAAPMAKNDGPAKRYVPPGAQGGDIDPDRAGRSLTDRWGEQREERQSRRAAKQQEKAAKMTADKGAEEDGDWAMGGDDWGDHHGYSGGRHIVDKQVMYKDKSDVVPIVAKSYNAPPATAWHGGPPTAAPAGHDDRRGGAPPTAYQGGRNPPTASHQPPATAVHYQRGYSGNGDGYAVGNERNWNVSRNAPAGDRDRNGGSSSRSPKRDRRERPESASPDASDTDSDTDTDSTSDSDSDSDSSDSSSGKPATWAARAKQGKREKLEKEKAKAKDTRPHMHSQDWADEGEDEISDEFTPSSCDEGVVSDVEQTDFWPEGLHVAQDFLTMEEERKLLAWFRRQTIGTKKDDPLHFGYTSRFPLMHLASKPVPDLPVDVVTSALGVAEGIPKVKGPLDRPSQLTVQEHHRGEEKESIMHDPRIFRNVVSLVSCGADCYIDFTPLPRIDAPVKTIKVPRKSLVVLSGSIMRDFMYTLREAPRGEKKRASNRVSFTFRHVYASVEKQAQEAEPPAKPVRK